MNNKPKNVPEFCRSLGVDPRRGRASLRDNGLKAPYSLDKATRAILRKLKPKIEQLNANEPTQEVEVA